MSDMIVAALQAAISISAVYLFATLGEILTQRSGVMNLGVEGMIMMGAVAACITASATESLFLAVLASMLVAGIFAALHAFVSVTLKSSQVVSGLALTILGSGLARFLGALLKLGKCRFLLRISLCRCLVIFHMWEIYYLIKICWYISDIL